jgi:tetratricopeptide (TPR) repeat protein
MTASAREHERAGSLRQAAIQMGNAGFAALEAGAYAAAEPVLRQALALAETLGVANVISGILANLGVALYRLGRLDEAHELVTQSIAAFHAQGDARLEGSSRAHLADVLAARGDLVGALAAAQEAARGLTIVPPLLAGALARVAALLLASGRVRDALSTASAASAILESLGGALEEGESIVRLVHARTLREAGDQAAAARAIADAKDSILARAEKITDAEWRRTFLAIPEHAETLALAQSWAA